MGAIILKTILLLVGITAIIISGMAIRKMRMLNTVDPTANIGTIVVDHSDENTNIFLEIASDDIDKWEDQKQYIVKVEIRDYVPQE